jgi:hypothetical protein
METGAVSTEIMRRDYQSLAKKSLQGKEFMKKHDMAGGSLNKTMGW